MIHSSLFLLTPLFFALCGLGSSAVMALEASPTPTAQASAVLTPQPPSELGTLIAAGRLPDLHWPDFADHQADVAKFYSSSFGIHVTKAVARWSTCGSRVRSVVKIETCKKLRRTVRNEDALMAQSWRQIICPPDRYPLRISEIGSS
jgi:hypothetical protein